MIFEKTREKNVCYVNKNINLNNKGQSAHSEEFFNQKCKIVFFSAWEKIIMNVLTHIFKNYKVHF